MKKRKICLLILVLTLGVMMAITITSYALDNPNYYEPNALQEEDVKEFEEFGGRIAGVIQIIGIIVSVGALMIIGIRYMLSSVEEKAEYKERLFPYIIGAVLLFAASNLVNIIYIIFHNIE